ncbi:MAG TPA: nucleotide exchange factor GrpE [Allocoleopsis sp.]
MIETENKELETKLKEEPPTPSEVTPSDHSASTSQADQKISDSATEAAETMTLADLEIPAEEEPGTKSPILEVPNNQQKETQLLIEQLKGEIETLKSQQQETNGQLENYKSSYMRTVADFDNFRKRTQKEKEDLEHQVKAATILKLLTVVDDFERARSLIKPQNEGETNIHKSYQGVYKQLVDALKKLGVAPMRPEGKEFDPNLHEAVMRQPTSEYPEGAVIEELVRGYFLGDRVLRHSMVKVAAPPLENSDTTGHKPDNLEN